MDDKKNKEQARHNVAKIFQMIFFAAMFFCLFNLVFKYLGLQLASLKLKDGLPEGYYDFNWEYLYKGTTQPYPLIGISFLLSVLITTRLDTLWQTKHGNKEIKSDDRWMNLKEIKENFSPVNKYELWNAETGGITVDIKGKIAYLDTENIHTLVIGTTRSGKGQTVILPLIMNITSAQEKQSFITNDMKGDNIENTYSFLEENDYTVYVLNLDDANRSDEWDLLYEAKREYLKVVEDEEPDLSACTKIIDSLASLFTDNPKSDPVWPDCAHALLVAMILYMIDKGYNSGQLDKVTMPSVYQLFITYGSHNEVRNRIKVNALDELFQSLPHDHIARASYASSKFADGEMRSSIFSILSSNLKIFATDMGVQKITSGNTIDFSKISDEEKPCAVYLILPDEDRSRDIIASAFVNQVYDYLVKQAKKCPNKYLKRRVQFILDEFASMPRIPAMDTKVSIGAGHNILFTLVVQDLNQLDDKYGTSAKSIRGTIGNLIYINSIDKDTNSYISALLGSQQFEYKTYSGNLRDWLNHQNVNQETKPLLSPTQLSRLKKNKAVVIRQRCFPILANLNPFYKYGFPITPIEDIPLHEIIRKLKASFYPIEEFQSSINMNVIRDTTQPESITVAPPQPEEEREQIDIVDVDEEQQTAENNINELFGKLNAATNGKFAEAMNNGNYERAEQIAKNESRLRKTISVQELQAVLAELSQFY